MKNLFLATLFSLSFLTISVSLFATETASEEQQEKQASEKTVDGMEATPKHAANDKQELDSRNENVLQRDLKKILWSLHNNSKFDHFLREFLKTEISIACGCFAGSLLTFMLTKSSSAGLVGIPIGGAFVAYGFYHKNATDSVTKEWEHLEWMYNKKITKHADKPVDLWQTTLPEKFKTCTVKKMKKNLYKQDLYWASIGTKTAIALDITALGAAGLYTLGKVYLLW